MHGTKVDVIAINMNQLANLRVNFEMNLYFAPYIMSLIKAKTRVGEICDVKHLPFRPFKNDTAFLERPLTPFPDDVVEGDDFENENKGEARNQGANVDQQNMPPPPPTQQQWVPSAGYFDRYFATMQQGISTQFDGLATQVQQQLNFGISEYESVVPRCIDCWISGFGAAATH
jgi:hypothetical protein